MALAALLVAAGAAWWAWAGAELGVQRAVLQLTPAQTGTLVRERMWSAAHWPRPA